MVFLEDVANIEERGVESAELRPRGSRARSTEVENAERYSRGMLADGNRKSKGSQAVKFFDVSAINQVTDMGDTHEATLI